MKFEELHLTIYFCKVQKLITSMLGSWISVTCGDEKWGVTIFFKCVIGRKGISGRLAKPWKCNMVHISF